MPAWWRTFRRTRSYPVDPLGPIFVSYRSSDAGQIAEETAWLMRAFGLPVWHDKTDLPPGDIGRRLEEALRSGLSGGVLVTSSEASESEVIQEVEAPTLLRLSEGGDFTFAVGSLLTKPGSSRLDLDAPDRILGFRPGTLRKYKQYALNDAESRCELARSLAIQRMKLLSAQRVAEIGVDIQTRSVPVARRGALPIMIRTRPPLGSARIPTQVAWENLAMGLRYLPDSVDASGADRVMITGGAHLSAAFALGAAVPTGSRWPVSVRAQDSCEWAESATPSVELLDELQCGVEELSRDADRIAVLVDLLEGASRTDAFDAHIGRERFRYACALRFSLSTRRRIDAGEGYAIATQVVGGIREHAARVPTSRISVFLLTPFPLAVILGRMANTLEVELHEWDDSVNPPEYRPVALLRCGCANSPIVQVLAR